MQNADFTTAGFSASDRETALVVDVVLEQLSPGVPARILEIGCGVGAVCLELARRRSEVRVVGVDISPANVEAAQANARVQGVADRADFVAQDYLTFQDGNFDLILSNSVLYVIPAPLPDLAAKMVRDLVPGGGMVLIMPTDCPSNRLLITLRRILRCLRSHWLEDAALVVAKRIYPDWDEAQLRDRIPYLYIIPVHLDSPAFRAVLAAAGLESCSISGWLRSSMAKLKHSLVLYRKRA